jgi:hypothetical protein
MLGGELSGPDRRKGALLLALVLAATAAAYARTFTVPFQFDDHDQILGNPAFRDPTIERLFGWGRTRVIPFLTLALNHRLGGDDVVGYHLVNLAIHLLNCFLVFRLALALCATPRLRGSEIAEQKLVLATAAALVFACHPIQVQAVTYIVQRVAALAATFFIGSVLAYVTARRRQEEGEPGAGTAFALCGLLALAAFFSKENTATLPLALLAVDAAFFPGASLGRSLLRVLPIVVLLGAIPVVWLLFWSAPSRAPIAAEPNPLLRLLQAGAPAGDVSPFNYFLTQLTVIPRYLTLVFLPFGLNVDHDVPIVGGVSGPVVAGSLVVGSLLVAGLVAVRRLPLVGFGVIWFFVAIAVESSFLPITDAMMEHRIYLPMVGVSLVLAAGLARVHARLPALTNVLIPVLGAALVASTVARNEVWRSELSLWQDALAKSPGKARPHLNVGSALHRSGDSEAAIPYYCEALRLDPKSIPARSNLDIALQARLDRMLEDDSEFKLQDRHDDFELRAGKGGEVMIFPKDPCK